MKKVAISTLMILSVLMSFNFSSCSANDNSSDDGKLKYYTYYEDTISSIIKNYNNYCTHHYDESYQIEIVEFDSQEEMNLNLSTEVMSGGGPDIFSSEQNLPYEKLTESKALTDIDEIIDIYDYDIGLDNCNQTVMDAGVIDSKRFFLPLEFSPDVFITTEKTLEKYNLTPENFSFNALSKQLSNSEETYSLLGQDGMNIIFFYSFLNQYVDFTKGETDFDTDEFSENLDMVVNLIENSSGDENIYYWDYENINNGASILYKMDSPFQQMVRACAFIYHLGGTPAIVPNYNRDENAVLASVDLSIGFNNNCKNKEKLLAFARYCLSDDTQIKMNTLPVSNSALKQLFDLADKPIDIDEDGSVDDNEKSIFQKAREVGLSGYSDIIDNISGCQLYGFNFLHQTYYNSSVIGDIVDDYLSGSISKDKFILRLTAATEIYLTE